MPGRSSIPIVLTERERSQLQSLVRQHKTPQQLALRAWIIFEADVSRNVSETVARLQVSRSLVQRWRE